MNNQLWRKALATLMTLALLCQCAPAALADEGQITGPTVQKTKIAITIDVSDVKADYDGQAHVPTVSVTKGELLSGHKIGPVTFDRTNFTDVTHGAEQVYIQSVTIVDASGNDVSDRYAITTKHGNLHIKAGSTPQRTPLAVRATVRVPYTGQAADLSHPDFSVAQGVLNTGDTIASGTITPPTGADLVLPNGAGLPVALSGVVIRNAAGEDVTAQYSIDYPAGSLLIIQPIPITVKAVATVTYNGQPADFSQAVFSLTKGKLISGDAVVSGTCSTPKGVNVTKANNSGVHFYLSNAVIHNAAGEDVTAGYQISYSYNINLLRINRRPLELSLSDVTADHDGKEHAPTVSVTGGGLAAGDTISAIQLSYDPARNLTDVTGDTPVAVSLASVTITNAAGEDVTACYSIGETSPCAVTIRQAAPKAPTSIAVVAESINAPYTGQPVDISHPTFKVYSGALNEGDTIVSGTVQIKEGADLVHPTPSTTEIRMKPVDLVIHNAAGEDVTDQYKIRVYDYGKLRISRRSLTLTASRVNVYYDGKEHAPTVTVTGDVAPGQTLSALGLSYDPARNFTDATENNLGTIAVSPAPVTVTDDATGADVTEYYNITYKDGFVFIHQMPITIAALKQEVSYNGAAHDTTDVYVKSQQPLQGSHVLKSWGLEVAPGVTTEQDGVVYEGLTNTRDANDGYPYQARAALRACNAVIWDPVTDTDVTSNYRIAYELGYVIVRASKLVLRPAPQSVPYDGQPHGMDAAAAQIDFLQGELKDGDRIASIRLDGSFTDAGTHAVAASGVQIVNASGKDVTSTYGRIGYQSGALTITPAPLTLAVQSASYPWDNAEHEVTYAIDGGALATGDELVAVVLQNAKRTELGTSDVTFDESLTRIERAGRDVTANYTISYVPGTLALTPALTATLTLAPMSLVYDGAAHAPALSIADGNGQPLDPADFTIEYRVDGGAWQDWNAAPPALVNAATYRLDVRASQTGYQPIADIADDATIAPRPVTFIAGTRTETHTGQPFTVGFAAAPTTADSGLVSGHVPSATLIDATRTDVGTNPVLFDEPQTAIADATGASVLANYAVSYAPGSITVNPANVAFTVEYYYDGVLDPAETVLTNGTVGAEVTYYVSKNRPGMRANGAQNYPLLLTENPESNVMRLYYITRPAQALLVEVQTPLAGTSVGVNVGEAMD